MRQAENLLSSLYQIEEKKNKKTRTGKTFERKNIQIMIRKSDGRSSYATWSHSFKFKRNVLLAIIEPERDESEKK